MLDNSKKISSPYYLVLLHPPPSQKKNICSPDPMLNQNKLTGTVHGCASNDESRVVGGAGRSLREGDQTISH